MNIKFKIKVYSDREIEYPAAYFNKTFQGFSQYWTPISFNGAEMIVESNVHSTSEDKIEALFDRLTPEMYQSTTRSYRVMKDE